MSLQAFDICHCKHLTKMSGERNVAGAFPLDQSKGRLENGVDYSKCVICQNTPEKGLMTIKLASVSQNSVKLILLSTRYSVQ